MAKLTQNELLLIFNQVKTVMKPYEKGTIKTRFNRESRTLGRVQGNRIADTLLRLPM